MQMPRERGDPGSIVRVGVASLQARVRRAVAASLPRGQADDPGVPRVSLANANWLRQSSAHEPRSDHGAKSWSPAPGHRAPVAPPAGLISTAYGRARNITRSGEIPQPKLQSMVSLPSLWGVLPSSPRRVPAAGEGRSSRPWAACSCLLWTRAQHTPGSVMKPWSRSRVGTFGPRGEGRSGLC
jgi:hypothetical protein